MVLGTHDKLVIKFWINDKLPKIIFYQLIDQSVNWTFGNKNNYKHAYKAVKIRVENLQT